MRICVIDGQGGKLGTRLIQGLRTKLDATHEILAIGTNSAAAEAMRRAGAGRVGVGVRAIQQTAPTADVILASLNIVLPGSLLGEITTEIAGTILRAQAKKVLLPVNRSKLEIMGVEGRTLNCLIDQAILRVRALLQQTSLVGEKPLVQNLTVRPRGSELAQKAD